MTTAFLSRFTPSLMSPKALEAIFVQREALIGRLVALTRDSVLTLSKHYTLLIGPRGIGKTHLMALIYYRLTAMADLRDGMRLAWLREEEWGVTSFLELLLRIFTALIEEYQDKTLAAQVQALYELPPPEARRQAEALLLAYCEQRTLVLLMENLDELFNEFGDAGQQHFRAYLQEHPFCTIVATAQSLFNGVSRQKSPFYGFFRLHHLEELQLDEAVQLLTRIAQYEQHPALVAFLQQPRGRARVQALSHLAGGNHRVYVILAQFLTRESLDELVQPFLSMLDDLTPYYQARMAWLSPQQRKLVSFLCDHRGALPVKEIARHCFMSQQTAASQLQKLSQMGYVRSTAEGRESFYELREPLLRMGVEVKKHRGQPIRLFVEFLRSWYTPGELEARVELLQPHVMLDREYLQAALQPARAIYEGERSEASMNIVPQANDLEPRGQGEKVFSTSDKALVRSSHATQLRNNHKGTVSEESRHEDAIVVYDDVLAHFGNATEPALQEQVAKALFNKGYRLSMLGRREEIIAVCDEVLARFGNATEPALQERIARALVNKGITLGTLGRNEDALAVYDAVLARFGNATEPALQEQVARALLNKGVTLGMLGRNEDALAVYDAVLARFGNATEPALQEQVARALLNKGQALAKLGHYGQALEAYDAALVRNLAKAILAMASYHRASVLFALHRWNDALPALDDALTRFPRTYDLLGVTPADASLRLLLSGTEAQLWPAHIAALLTCYSQHKALAWLGQGLVRSIATLYSPMVSHTAAQTWRDIWQEHGGHDEALAIPLRLLDAAVRYRETHDRRVLLRLPMEERKVLEQVLEELRIEN